MRDPQIRRLLNRGVLQTHRHESDTRIVEELGVLEGASRIDIAVVNGHLHGFEIKSEHDSLSRLPQQVTAYNRIFDKLTLVVSAKHFAPSQKVIPSWWGVLVLEKGSGRRPSCLIEAAPPRTNEGIDAYAVAQLLWRDEAASILEGLGASTRLLNKPRPVLWQALTEYLLLDDLKQKVRSLLKIRKAWRSGLSPS